MSNSLEKELEKVKRALHPEKPMNIIDQCEIIRQALEGPYIANREGLAMFLEISASKVYQMDHVAKNLHPDVKEWFRGLNYQCHTPFEVSRLSPEAQWEFLENAKTLKL